MNSPQQVKLIQLTFFNQKMFPLFVFKLATFQSMMINNPMDQLQEQNEKGVNLDITIKQVLNHLLSNGLFEVIQKEQLIIGLNQQTELQNIRFEVSINQYCKSYQDQKIDNLQTNTKILKLNDNINSIRYKNKNRSQCFEPEIIHLQVKIKIQTEIQQQMNNKVSENVKETEQQQMIKMIMQQKTQLPQIVQIQTKTKNLQKQKQEDQSYQREINSGNFLKAKIQEQEKQNKQSKTKNQFQQQDKVQDLEKPIINHIYQTEEIKQKNIYDYDAQQKYQTSSEIKQKNIAQIAQINQRPIIKLSRAKLQQLISKQHEKQNKQFNLLKKRKDQIQHQQQQYKKDGQQAISIQNQNQKQKQKIESYQVVQLCKVIFYEINDSVENNNNEDNSKLKQLEICHIKKMTILKNKILSTHDVYFDQNAQNPINRVNIILKDTNLYCIKKQSNSKLKSKNKLDNNLIQNQERKNKLNQKIFLNNNASNNNSKEALQKTQSQSWPIFQTYQTDKIQVNQKDAVRIQKFRERTILKSSSLRKFNKHKLGRFKSEQTVSNHSQQEEPVEVQIINTMEQFVQKQSTPREELNLNHHSHRSQKIIQNQNFLIKTKKNDISLKRNPESPKKSPLSPLKKYKNEYKNQTKTKNNTKQVQINIQELLADKLFTNKSQEYRYNDSYNQLTPHLTKINSENMASQKSDKDKKQQKQKNKQSIFKIRKPVSLLNNVLKIITEQTQKKNPIIVRQNTNHLGLKNIIQNHQDQQYSTNSIQLKQKNSVNVNVKRIKGIFNAYCTPLTLQKSKSHKN